MSSFKDMQRRSHSPRERDIVAYRNVASKKGTQQNLGFLDQSRHDLLCLRGSGAYQVSSSGRACRTLVLGPPALVLLAFFAFWGVPSMISRLLLLGVLSYMGHAVLYQTERESSVIGIELELSTQERRVCLCLYVGVLAAIAAAVR